MRIFWNRKEVFIGNSLNRFNEIKNLLLEEEIEYTQRIIHKNNAPLLGEGRRSKGILFKHHIKYPKTYYIYVHKKDYNRALEVLRKYCI